MKDIVTQAINAAFAALETAAAGKPLQLIALKIVQGLALSMIDKIVAGITAELPPI